MYHVAFHVFKESLYLFVFVFGGIPDLVRISWIGLTVMMAEMARLTG